MRMLEENEYLELMSFLKKKTFALWEHERHVQKEKGLCEKNYFQSGFPRTLCFVHKFDNDAIAYRIYSNRFLSMIRECYLQALNAFPEKFGTGNAKDIMQALYNDSNVSGYFNSYEDYIKYLQPESCCYIVLKENNVFSDNILRIDLFREYKQSKDDKKKYEFVGGLFHAFKHFSFEGKNLSIGTDVNNIDDLEKIVWLCIRAFRKEKNPSKSEWKSSLPLNTDYELLFSFYYEDDTKSFFIKTVYKQAIKH